MTKQPVNIWQERIHAQIAQQREATISLLQDWVKEQSEQGKERSIQEKIAARLSASQGIEVIDSLLQQMLFQRGEKRLQQTFAMMGRMGRTIRQLR